MPYMRVIRSGSLSTSCIVKLHLRSTVGAKWWGRGQVVDAGAACSISQHLISLLEQVRSSIKPNIVREKSAAAKSWNNVGTCWMWRINETVLLKK